ncbi:MAG: ABC transporter ATP-binding protein [Planctomycetota bacterium]
MNSKPPIALEGVWKKFRRGQNHDALRDLIPSLVKGVLLRKPTPNLNEFWALRDVSFQVDRGEAIGIIGPNGAGKSTILKILSGIMRPNRGAARVTGRLSSLIEVGAGFHFDLTGRENIYLNGAILGMSRREMDRKFDAIVDFAELADFIDTPIKRYSSGMHARLGFSVAAHMDPDVLLVDEVLSVGDMAFQNKCLKCLERFRREGTTIVFVSHNLQAVTRTCRRVIVLHKGTIVCDAPPAEAISRYLRTSSTPRSTTSAADRRAEVLDVKLTTLDGLPAGEVSPGTSLRLQAKCSFLTHAQDITFGFVLTRAVDNLIVYTANVSELGVAPLEVHPGTEVDLEFDFLAHLTRGVYCLTVHVKDLSNQSYLDYAQGCAVFDVREQASHEGVADVGLRCRCQPHRPGKSASEPSVTAEPMDTRHLPVRAAALDR